MKIRNLTEQQAIDKGLSKESDTTLKSSHCPECGCPWFGNKNMCGEGHRVCGDCYQDWYTDVAYAHQHELRELPDNLTIDKFIEYLYKNAKNVDLKQYNKIQDIVSIIIENLNEESPF